MTADDAAYLERIAAALRDRQSETAWPTWMTDARRQHYAGEIEAMALALRQA